MHEFCTYLKKGSPQASYFAVKPVGMMYIILLAFQLLHAQDSQPLSSPEAIYNILADTYPASVTETENFGFSLQIDNLSCAFKSDNENNGVCSASYQNHQKNIYGKEAKNLFQHFTRAGINAKSLDTNVYFILKNILCTIDKADLSQMPVYACRAIILSSDSPLEEESAFD